MYVRIAGYFPAEMVPGLNRSVRDVKIKAL